MENGLPDLWVEGAFLYMDSLAQASQGRNIDALEGGLGVTCDFRTAWLPHGYGNFSVYYYPRSGVLYKSIQVGWDILPHFGLSFGGLGIRIADGRYDSSFVFSIRIRFGILAG
ncbi:MAG TPA: hypothetical protein VLM37_08830 [Fibrobacteraceae bacterium]|nr:hypothetical protein [Fibrobacteraceae bacterium]